MVHSGGTWGDSLPTKPWGFTKCSCYHVLLREQVILTGSAESQSRPGRVVFVFSDLAAFELKDYSERPRCGSGLCEGGAMTETRKSTMDACTQARRCTHAHMYLHSHSPSQPQSQSPQPQNDRHIGNRTHNNMLPQTHVYKIYTETRRNIEMQANTCTNTNTNAIQAQTHQIESRGPRRHSFKSPRSRITRSRGAVGWSGLHGSTTWFHACT